MYDEIKARMPLVDEGQRKALLASEAFIETWRDQYGNNHARWDCFKLRLGPDSLTVAGSLHTLAQRNNGGRFTRTALIDSIAALCDALGVTPDQLTLYRIEFGVNLPLTQRPTLFLNSLRLHKGAHFYPMPPPSGSGRPLGFKAPHSQYEVKAYDKGEYIRHTNSAYRRQVLRFELRVTKIKWLLKQINRSTLTLADLPEQHLMATLGNMLERAWAESLPLELPPLHEMKRNDAILILASRNTQEWEAYLTSLDQNARDYLRSNVRKLQGQFQADGHPLTALLRDEVARVVTASTAAGEA